MATSDAVARYLAERLSGDHVVVASPDHPELLFGPDVLVGGAGRLAAVFIVGASTSFNHLRARLIASRLAFPQHARIVALLAVDRDIPLDIQVSLDEVARRHQRKLLLRASTADLPDRPNLRDLPVVRARNDLRYSTILQVATLRNRERGRGRSSTSIGRDFMRARRSEVASDRSHSIVEATLRRESKLRFVASYRGSTVAAIPNTQSRTARERLASIWRSGLTATFELNGGVPYPRELQPHIALVERTLQMENDPRKLVRASAFAGWALTSAESADEVGLFLERLQSVYAKRLNEWS